MNKIERIKSQYSMREEAMRVLKKPLKETTKYDKYACPFHAEETPGAFTIYDDRYYCYSCGESGDVLDFLVWAKETTLGDLLKLHDIDITPAELVQRQEEIAEIKRVAKERADNEYKNALRRLHEARAWERYERNLYDSDRAKQLWKARGLPVEWQAYFGLGYSPSFSYFTTAGKAVSETLVIPVRAVGGDVLTIRHRLLQPLDNRRYQPERSGLGSHPFICNTNLQKARSIVIIEGEIKAMVSYKTYDNTETQFVGIPSKSMMAGIIEKTVGRDVTVIPDPDSVDELVEACGNAGAKMLVLPDKIDDLINEYGLNQHWLHSVISQARVV